MIEMVYTWNCIAWPVIVEMKTVNTCLSWVSGVSRVLLLACLHLPQIVPVALGWQLMTLKFYPFRVCNWVFKLLGVLCIDNTSTFVIKNSITGTYIKLCTLQPLKWTRALAEKTRFDEVYLSVNVWRWCEIWKELIADSANCSLYSIIERTNWYKMQS